MLIEKTEWTDTLTRVLSTNNNIRYSFTFFHFAVASTGRYVFFCVFIILRVSGRCNGRIRKSLCARRQCFSSAFFFVHFTLLGCCFIFVVLYIVLVGVWCLPHFYKYNLYYWCWDIEYLVRQTYTEQETKSEVFSILAAIILCVIFYCICFDYIFVSITRHSFFAFTVG